MPISRYDHLFGGQRGAASKARRNMHRHYGSQRGERVFYGTVNRRRRKSGRTAKQKAATRKATAASARKRKGKKRYPGWRLEKRLAQRDLRKGGAKAKVAREARRRGVSRGQVRYERRNAAARKGGKKAKLAKAWGGVDVTGSHWRYTSKKNRAAVGLVVGLFAAKAIRDFRREGRY